MSIHIKYTLFKRRVSILYFLFTVVRRGRDKDAVTFAELHRKLQTQVSCPESVDYINKQIEALVQY